MVDEDGNPTSTGQAQFEGCVELIEEWNLKNNITAMCFDTSSSNTGVYCGCCSRFEKDFLGQRIFWFGCRHHVMELVAKAGWYSLFEYDLGPDNKFYQQVKDVWPQIDSSSTAPFKKLVLRSPFLQELKMEAMEYYIRVLTIKNKNGELPRDDYRQLAETSLLLLWGTPPGGIVWKKPGAVHK